MNQVTFPTTEDGLKDFMKIVSLFAILGSILILPGCGRVPDFGGGAGVVPDVTFVTGDSEAAVEAPTETNETASNEAASSGAAGTFSGKVVMTGAVTPLPPLIGKGAEVKDKEVCAAHEVANEKLVLGPGNAVQNVFIYLNKAPKGGKPLEVPAEPFLFDQKNCQFHPHCAIVPVGQLVKVLSGDPIAHNTHTNPNKNPSVNSLVGANDREGKVSFTYKKAEPTPFNITCDFHGWMNARQLAIDHPYAALTDENGSFTIPDLPAGKHAFIVWHEGADGGYVERKFEVEIKSGETTKMQIDYPADRFKL